MKFVRQLLALLNPFFWIRNRAKFSKAVRKGFAEGEDRAKQDVDSL